MPNLHEVLRLIDESGQVEAQALVQAFDVTVEHARVSLSRAKRRGHLSRVNDTVPTQYQLTSSGRSRLDYYERNGCSRRECSRCSNPGGRPEG